jgi:hypothetical protein
MPRKKQKPQPPVSIDAPKESKSVRELLDDIGKQESERQKRRAEQARLEQLYSIPFAGEQHERQLADWEERLARVREYFERARQAHEAIIKTAEKADQAADAPTGAIAAGTPSVPTEATPNERRARIVREMMESRQDFKNETKVKALLARLDAEGIPFHRISKPPLDRPGKWSDMKPRTKRYKDTMDVLKRNLFPRKK